MSVLLHMPVCYSNKFMVRVDDFHTRVTMFDVVDGINTPQGFFIMLNSDATELAKVIIKTQNDHLDKQGTVQ